MIGQDKFKKDLLKYLKAIGIPCNLRGYTYIVDAAEIIYFNTKRTKITETIYPIIAFKYDVSIASVERAIRHSIARAFLLGNLTTINLIFSSSVHPEKDRPSNLQFVTRLVEFIEEGEYIIIR